MFFDWGYYARFRHIAQLEILLPETFTNYSPYQVAWTVKWVAISDGRKNGQNMLRRKVLLQS